MNNRAAKRILTRLKRKSQICRVFELKIDHSKLSKKTLDHLYSVFREAKWYYNYVLSHENIDDAQTKIKIVPVKVGDNTEQRPLIALTAQMKQDIKARAFTSLKSLKTLKNNGHKIGRLRFKSRVNSVPLRQHEVTFYLDFTRSAVRIQGLKRKLRIVGLKQIKPDMEIANATLVNRNNNFYINVTTYVDKQEQHIPEQSIGIDFGCETQLTFSDGAKVTFQVPVTKRLRKLDRKIMRGNRKRSNNKRKDQLKRRKLYERLSNKKKDIRNKVVNAVTKNFKYVCFQDESIHAWSMSGHGKKIQNSGIGGIISDLKHKSHTPLEVSKWFPSTQLCPQCDTKNKLKQSDRVYECSCGFIEDRDVKSAWCIEREGLKNIPTDHREFKLEENCSSDFFNTLMKVDGVEVFKSSSMSQEALHFVVG